MLPSNLVQQVTDWTLAYGGHVRDRGYIGLSGIGDCEQVIYRRYMRGGPDFPATELLKLALGYELELALVTRLTKLGVYAPGETIKLFDGLVQGHTDGVIDGDLLEIKTLPAERGFGDLRGKLPRRVWWQVQAYLRYTGLPAAHVLYLARDTGALLDLPVRVHHQTGADICDKLFRLVAAVRDGAEPACSCGRCLR